MKTAAAVEGSTTAPVSYTHLDVYKRQVHIDLPPFLYFTFHPGAMEHLLYSTLGETPYVPSTDVQNSLQRGLETNLSISDGKGGTLEGYNSFHFISVSYTHLDVYKRQLIENIQRENLNSMEIAAAIDFLIKQHDLSLIHI